MGLFDIFKRKNNKNVREHAEAQENYGVPEKKEFDLLKLGAFSGNASNGRKYLLTNCQVMQTFVHRNGSRTVAVLGKIVEYKNEYDTIYAEFGENIGFEVDADKPVSKQICQKIIEMYDEQKDNKVNMDEELLAYMGIILEQDGQAVYKEPASDTVKNRLKDIVKQEQLAMDAEITRRDIEREQSDFAARIRFEADFQKRQAERQREIQNRLNNPYFENLGREGNFENYNGINLSNGDIMKLRGVKKVCKDSKSTYLYTAFVQNTPNEDDAERYYDDIPDGYPVAFETDVKLEDIAKKSNDSMAIRKILLLLNMDYKLMDSSQLTYIGKLDREGNIIRNGQAVSEALNGKLQQLKVEFDRVLSYRDTGR